eukprot:TRINITY_DN4493_c0_g1_i2.p1 TRINITY_DN4493_c0_g1~~TRINITY_DN4493_c0_g1_i2.p1  ORF type:complete len:197 (-),score=30.48 TRINITY_DN4493_c0_g1_i2:138-728(-)
MDTDESFRGTKERKKDKIIQQVKLFEKSKKHIGFENQRKCIQQRQSKEKKFSSKQKVFAHLFSSNIDVVVVNEKKLPTSDPLEGSNGRNVCTEADTLLTNKQTRKRIRQATTEAEDHLTFDYDESQTKEVSKEAMPVFVRQQSSSFHKKLLSKNQIFHTDSLLDQTKEVQARGEIKSLKRKKIVKQTTHSHLPLDY